MYKTAPSFSDTWTQSPARVFTSSNHLPGEKTGLGHGVTNLSEDVEVNLCVGSSEKPGIVNVIEAARGNGTREQSGYKLQLGSIGEKYGAIEFLSRANTLGELQAQLLVLSNEKGVSVEELLSDQSDEIKKAIIDDINTLNNYGEQIFGEIDPERLRSMIARTRKKCRAIIESETSETKDPLMLSTASKLLELLPAVPIEYEETNLPRLTDGEMEYWSEIIEENFIDLIRLVPIEKNTFNADDLAELFKQALDVISESWGLANAKDWSITRNKGNIKVDIDNKTINIPPSVPAKDYNEARNLVVHESGHLLRNLLGELSGDPFLATHMKGREADEESFLSTTGDILNRKNREAGAVYYIGIGLGLNKLDDARRYTPEEIEQIVEGFTIIEKLAEKGEEATLKLGGQRAHRILRGMPRFTINGVTHYAVYPADIKYAQGQYNAIEWLRHRSNALFEWMLGKYAYSDPKQKEYANTHGVSADSLPKLPMAKSYIKTQDNLRKEK